MDLPQIVVRLFSARGLADHRGPHDLLPLLIKSEPRNRQEDQRSAPNRPPGLRGRDDGGVSGRSADMVCIVSVFSRDTFSREKTRLSIARPLECLPAGSSGCILCFRWMLRHKRCDIICFYPEARRGANSYSLSTRRSSLNHELSAHSVGSRLSPFRRKTLFSHRPVTDKKGYRKRFRLFRTSTTSGGLVNQLLPPQLVVVRLLLLALSIGGPNRRKTTHANGALCLIETTGGRHSSVSRTFQALKDLVNVIHFHPGGRRAGPGRRASACSHYYALLS